MFAIVSTVPSGTTRLANGDTSVTLRAQSSFPQLTSLQLNGSEVWANQRPEQLIETAQVHGVEKRLRWQLQSRATPVAGNTVQFVYECPDPHLRLEWEWRVRGTRGPLEHTIRIENLGSTEVWLPLQDSFQFGFQVGSGDPLRQFWVEKGASSPSAEGTHCVALRAGNRWTGTSSTYAHPPKNAPREIIPYLLIQRANEQQSGWYLGVEFSGRTRIALRRERESVAGEAGLNPDPGPFGTRLRPGETFTTPTVFLGAFAGGPDGAANVLRRWIRDVLNSPATIHDASYPVLVSNSWGSGMAIDENQAHRMIQEAAALGLEMFHLDAGWFRNVGDWVSNPAKFPHGVAAVADFAHRLGLRFGLWTDWTQAGVGTGPGALNVHDPPVRDWLTLPPPAGWKPEDFKGITVDIGVPAARTWAEAAVDKIVSGFHLDMLEHDGYLVAQGCERSDHPHAPLEITRAKTFKEEGILWVQGSNDTDVSYHATRAYYEIQAGLRRRFPKLLLEICNDGGRMVDFGSAAHGDYFSITDAYDPLSNRRAFFDASYVLPPAMLETYVEKWKAGDLGHFRYMLRSGMMGWFSLMMDPTTWSAEQHRAAREEFAVYKSKLRPLIREADLYHVSNRPDGVHWDGMEYFNPKSGRGVLFAFRGSTEEGEHTFPLRGLRADGRYKLTFQDRSGEGGEWSGSDLMRSGPTVRLADTNLSELVFLEEVAR